MLAVKPVNTTIHRQCNRLIPPLNSSSSSSSSTRRSRYLLHNRPIRPTQHLNFHRHRRRRCRHYHLRRRHLLHRLIKQTAASAAALELVISINHRRVLTIIMAVVVVVVVRRNLTRPPNSIRSRLTLITRLLTMAVVANPQRPHPRHLNLPPSVNHRHFFRRPSHLTNSIRINSNIQALPATQGAWEVQAVRAAIITIWTRAPQAIARTQRPPIIFSNNSYNSSSKCKC